jgi:hypothetical protein
MKNIGALLKYYTDVSLYSLGVSVIASLYTSILWGFFLFCTLGVGIGLLCFQYFKKNEYYFYYNLGWTKWRLALLVVGINTVIAIPILFISALFLWLI